MILVRLNHRLGNQMFQYAFGRCLANKWGHELFLDTTLLGEKKSSNPAGSYGLDIFNIEENLTTLSSVRIPPRGLVISVREISVSLFDEVLSFRIPSSSILILIGSWQSHKYFAEATNIIRQDFTFKPLEVQARKVADQIDSSCSVAVHVRRGDYLFSGLGAHLGFIGLDYYYLAISIITARMPQAHFFIFSDDLEWCAANFHLERPHTFVQRPTCGVSYVAEDLYLMSRCSHFVIANSTYSWWAAWLSSNANKLVIAPHRWFADERWDSSNLCPSTWLTI